MSSGKPKTKRCRRTTDAEMALARSLRTSHSGGRRPTSFSTALARALSFCLLGFLGPLQAESAPVTAAAPNANAVTSRAVRTATSEKLKPEVLSRLKTLQSQHAQEITNLDEQIRKRLLDSRSIDLSQGALKLSSRKLKDITSSVETLTARRTEMVARREVWERLAFAIESKWTNQPLGPLLEAEAMEIALRDLSEGLDTRLWKFMTYLSVALREIPDPREDVINVMEGYMSYAGVVDPKTPAEFLADRQYTSGSLSFTANPMSRDTIGDGAHGTTRTTTDRMRNGTTSGSTRTAD